MFSTEKYLECLGYEGPAEATVAALREIHRRHQMALPFDAGYVSELAGTTWDLDAVFDTVVPTGRGGVCVELNLLLHRLLVELGFEVRILSAGTPLPRGAWGPDVEHMALHVRIDGGDWLADVGHAGVSPAEPLRISEEIQEQDGVGFRLIRQDAYHVVQYRTRNRDWRPAYRFLPQPRDVTDWLAGYDVDDALPPRLGPRRRRRVTDNGQVMLTANLFLAVEDGQERLSLLRDEDELEKVIATYWG
jgi:amide synthase